MEDIHNADSEMIVAEFEKQPRKLIDPTNIDTQSRKYWQRIFKIMDEYSAIPHHKRENVLRETLADPGLFLKIQEIYDVHKHSDVIDFEDVTSGGTLLAAEGQSFMPGGEFLNYKESDMELLEMERRLTLLSTKFTSGLLNPPPSAVALETTNYVDYRKELTKLKDDSNRSADSMYIKFLKKSPEEARRWRPKPALTLDGMKLREKCDAITKKIAASFVAWMNSIGGEATLDEAAIEGLFEIGFNCHAADSLKIHMQELNAVTDEIAYSRQTPELSYSTQLYRQLHRDKSAVRSREANYAFGTMLPPEMRSGTNEDSDVAKWLENKRVPDKLATMAAVWEGIETLKSTEGYCNWLLEHEDLPLPLYLARKGIGDTQKTTEQLNSNTQVAKSKLNIHSKSASDTATN